MAVTKRYFPELTGVRAVMMYCVFNCHFNLVGREAYGEPIYRFSPTLHDWLLRFTHELAIGVPVFYVLSGFLIYYRYGRELASLNRRWLANYVQNRIARIYPVYFVVLLATYYCWVMLPQQFPHRALPDGRTLLVTFSLTQSFFPDLVKAGIPQAWTLTIEESFYFAAPLLFLAARRSAMLWPCLGVFLIGVLLVNVPLIGSYYGNPTHVFGRTLCGPIGCFGFGAYLAQVVIRRDDALPSGRQPWWTTIGLSASILVVLFVSRLSTWNADQSYLHRGVDHGLGATLIFTVFPAAVAATFWGLITEESWLKRMLASRTMVLLGGASYCFYLIHVGALQHLVFEYISTNYLVLFAIVNVVAVAMFLLLEKPANAYLKHLGWVPGANPLQGFPESIRQAPGRFSYFALAAALFVCFAVPELLRWADNARLHNALLREDGLYETMQAAVCAAAAIVFAYAWLARGSREGLHGGARLVENCFLGAMTVMMLAMFGEEISWGQRLFGFATPEWMRQQNFQGEFTLHNWDLFQTQQSGNLLQTTWLITMVVYLGLVSGVACVWPRLRKWAEAWGLALASGPVALLTVLCFGWYVLTNPWSEVLELALDLMLLALAIEIVVRRPRIEWRWAPDWLPVGVAGAVAPLLLLFLFQGGEQSLPAVRSRQLSDEGNRQFEQGASLQAVAMWQQALDEWPRNSAAHWALGQWHAHHRELHLAERHLHAVIELEPDHVEARVVLARVWRTQGRYEDALAMLERALEIEADHGGARSELADTLLKTGRAPEALEIYRGLLAVSPGNAELANRLAWYLATLPDTQLRDGAEAVRLAELACQQTDFQHPSYLSTLAAAYAEAGDFEQAMRTAEQAMELASATGLEQLAAANRERVKQFRAGQAVRVDPAG